MKYQNKNEGISLLIAMGGSFVVLLVAFSVLLSMEKMLSQMDSLERSTKLFFAAESGIEAAFYHHNSRGVGVDFGDVSAVAAGGTQTISLLNNNIEARWTIEGQSGPGTAVPGEAPIIGLLKEGQSVQIPLTWNSSSGPEGDPAGQKYVGGDTGGTDYFQVTFYKDSTTMNESATFEDLFGGAVKVVDAPNGIPANFDFGKEGGSGEEEILIDWSVSRLHSRKGIQTFNPLENDCDLPSDFICENSLRLGNVILDSRGTNDTKGSSREGRVLPSFSTIRVTIDDFLNCDDRNPLQPAEGGACSDYVLTFRPLLKFTHTNLTEDTTDDIKIPGIPYSIIAEHTATSNKSIPKQSYTVESVVSAGDFSQRVTLEVPEKTSIGAFDYVIFD